MDGDELAQHGTLNQDSVGRQIRPAFGPHSIVRSSVHFAVALKMGAVVSIKEQGFLSADVAHFIGKHRQDNKAAFDLADALNRTAQRLMLGAEVKIEGDTFSEKNLAQLLFVRALSNFQGVILMIATLTPTEPGA